MQMFLSESHQKTVILRHRKENLKKCSLKGLEFHEDFQFFTYPLPELPSFPDYILLTIDAPPLTKDDCNHGLLLLDGTWKYAEKMQRFVLEQQQWICRSIPKGWVTAYPRRQEDCPDPSQGLASIEAIFVAYHITGRNTEGLLDHYYWREAFLTKNQKMLHRATS